MILKNDNYLTMYFKAMRFLNQILVNKFDTKEYPEFYDKS